MVIFKQFQGPVQKGFSERIFRATGKSVKIKKKKEEPKRKKRDFSKADFSFLVGGRRIKSTPKRFITLEELATKLIPIRERTARRVLESNASPIAKERARRILGIK